MSFNFFHSFYRFLDKYNYFKKIHRTYEAIQKIELDLFDLNFEIKKIKLKNNEKIKIHFLFIIDSYWASWKSFYEACLSDPEVEVKIIFLDMSKFDNKTSQHSTAQFFLDSNQLSYVYYDEYHINQELPHVLIYQTPYQWCFNSNFLDLKVKSVKKLGIRPVYISYGIEYDTTVNTDFLNKLHYKTLTMEHAWKIFVMHKDIQQGFFTHCKTGGHHVHALGHPKFDIYKNTQMTLAQGIKDKANGKKILVYQIHFPNDNDCIKTKRLHTLQVHETAKIIKAIQDQEDYFVIVTIHPLFMSEVLKKRLASQYTVEEMKKNINEHKNSYLYTGDHQQLIFNGDVFITENSSLMIEMAYFDKPVLYLYDVPVAMKSFAQNIIATFHHGKTVEDVKSFLGAIKNGDPLLEKRKKVQQQIFTNYDGKIGYRIKENITQAIKSESS